MSARGGEEEKKVGRFGASSSALPSCSSCHPVRQFPLLCVLFCLPPFAAAAEKPGGPSGGNAEPAGLNIGLVAHYPFDGDASDASGHGHHGVNHGATPVPGGKLGGAFAFNGVSSYVAIPLEATQGLTWLTVAAWVRTTQSEARPRTSFWSNPTVIGFSTGGYGSRDFGLMVAGGNAAYFHGLRADSSDISFFPTAPLADDQWHPIAFVNEGPRALLYVDGRLVRGEALWHRGDGLVSLGLVTQTASGTSLGAAQAFIGACNESSAPRYFFRGLLDDLRLWSRALTPEEVASLAR